MESIAVRSKVNDLDRWEMRHKLAWRQLSLFWDVPIKQVSACSLPEMTGSVAAYSIALDSDDAYENSAFEIVFNSTPTVAFLNNVFIKFHEKRLAGKIENQISQDIDQHVFHVKNTHPLCQGLPAEVVIYGPLENITVLNDQPGLQPLVSLDGKPIIGCCPPHLLIGADPWQLGKPTIPLVYPIVKKWLEITAGYEIKVDPPYAMIRLDDFPITAASLLDQPPTPSLDRYKAAKLRHLRRFAASASIKMTLMYTSHYYATDGRLKSIGDVFPRSIREIRLGLEQNVFEVGAHGMVHLRYPWKMAVYDNDPREFLDLDKEETQKHIENCLEEIWRLFQVQPKSFVAPAWGYKPTVTKPIAKQYFDVVIDSSLHMEDGTCEVFSAAGEEFPALNCAETFRPSDRMLSYTSSNFWKCYALAGVPLHFLQHDDHNWFLLLDYFRNQNQILGGANNNGHIAESLQNSSNPRFVRAVSAMKLGVSIVRRRPASVKYIRKLLTRNSIYQIINAIGAAGYQCIGLDQYLRFRATQEQQIIRPS